MKDLIDTHDALIAIYKIWNKEQGLQLGSADDHVNDENLTYNQQEWLRAYVRLWAFTEE
jgi:hypothetical protein|tara:strand:- start:675 stop:851 length:177 start_codon:yes stop_codon:yes gene_type:complete